MNKIKINNKISKVLLLILFIILSTTSVYKVNAESMEMTFQKLKTDPNLYCSEHGAPLAGSNPEYKINGGRYQTSFPYSGISLSETQVSYLEYCNWGGDNYIKRENSLFHKIGESFTTAAEADVLINGGGYTSSYQPAWWLTLAGQGYLHTSDGDKNGNEYYLAYNIDSEMFNADNRALAATGTSLLDNFKNANENTNSYIEVAGKIVNFAAKEKQEEQVEDVVPDPLEVKKDVVPEELYENPSDKPKEVSNEVATGIADFVKYIEEMTGKKDAVCDENGFKFTRKFDWINKDVEINGKTIPYSNPTVAKDGDKFIVGPFALDYVDMGKYSYMNNMKMEIRKDDGTTQILEHNSHKNEFEIKKESKGIFPEPNETFYIVFDSIKNASSIKNIMVNFKYMNATAKYSLWDGSLTETKGNIVAFTKEVEDDDGSTHLEYYLKRTETVSTQNAQTIARKEEPTKYWYEELELKRGIEIVESCINVRKEITTEDGKEIDEDSLSKDINNKTFDFELVVNGANSFDNISGEETKEILRVTAGKRYSTESRVYYWLKNGENDKKVPTFTLKEIDKNGYTISNISEIKTNGHGSYANGVFTGTLISDTTLNLKATNIMAPHKGNIIVIKEIDKDASEAGKNFINGKEFNIKLTIKPPAKGFFKYNGKYYGNNEENKTLEVIVTVKAEIGKQNSVTLPYDIEWYGEKAPTFEAEEILTAEQSQNIECKAITPKSGSLVDFSNTKVKEEDKYVKVTVTNTSKDHKAKLHIIKTVEINNNYSPELKELLMELLMEKIKNQTFKFDITVEGFEVEHAVIEKAKRENNKYIWEYTSSEYTWQGDANNGPHYEIKEVDAPAGTTMVPSPCEGNLTENVENDYKVDREIINKIDIKEHHAKIKLNKKVTTSDLQDKDFTFDIRLDSGIFTYKGKVYEPTVEKPVRLTNADGDDDGVADENQFITIHVGKSLDESPTASSSWESDEFTWYEYGTSLTDKPHYKVSEKLEGLNVKSHVINPEEGFLDDKDSDTIVINAINNGEETLEGKIRIIKVLTGADRFKIEDLKKYKFECEILIDYTPNNGSWDDAEKITAILTLKHYEEENKITWEWESENPIATWKEGEDNPIYKVTEINVPAGTVFDKFDDDTVSKEEQEVNGNSVSGKLKPLKEPGAEETLELKVNEVGIINKLENHKGKLAIKKEIATNTLGNKDFKFKVTIEGTFKIDDEEVLYDENGQQITKREYNNEKLTFIQTIHGAGKWESRDIEWGAISAPKYTVEEFESGEFECISMVNNSGTLSNNSTVTAVFKNKGKETESAYLKVTKRLLPGQTSDKKFKFDITIDGKTTTVELKAGQTYTSRSYAWPKTDSAPSYTVKEYSEDGSTLVSITDNAGNQGTVYQDGKGGEISGTLISGTTVEVVATNSVGEKEGRFKVRKQVIADEKYVSGLKDKEFKMTATITGNFLYGDNKEPHDGSLSIPITLKANETWESPKISWYGDNAPTVTVKEDLTGQEYKGWTNVGISNNGAAISENEVIELVVTNEYQIIPRLDLTVELAGDVWEDIPQKDSKNDPDSVPNGRMDSSEVGVDGVEVYIYKAGTNELATIYKNALDAIQEQPLVTSNNGHWDAFRVNLNDEKDEFEVRFVYDGQTYENTKLLALSNENIQLLIDKVSDEIRKADYGRYNDLSDERKIELFKSITSKTNRNYYAKTSMAKDIDRDSVDSRIKEVYGKSSIDGLGNTIGEVNGSVGTQTIYYTSNANDSGNQNRIVSTVKTTDDNGVAFDLFKATASTGNLTFPFGTNFEDRFHLTGSDTKITDYGTEIVYHYSATYDYTKHINLGLKRRPESDVELQKDLVSANVVVNDRLTSYTFNKLSDLGKDIYTRTLDDSSENYNLNYTLGLYKTDYYYRAEMYQTNMDKNEYDKIENFYKALGGINSTELEVYLQYKIAIRNSSSNKYDVIVNSIDDYYDSTFKLIRSEERKYVKTSDGKVQDETTVVAKEPKFEKEGFTSGVTINEKEKGIKGSDGVTYNKISIDLNGTKLASGETAYVYTSYKIEKGTYKGVQDAIALGGKSNIAEISNYSTLYADNNKIAGKIDKDSAPSNIDIRNHIDKTWFEDDSYIAPVLNLQFAENDRIVSGVAWEDNATEESIKKGESVGNGIYDNGEALIGGLTTELVEKVTIKDGNQYQDYDFVWPTSQRLDSLGGMSIEELSGFDSVIETSRGAAQSDGTIAGVGEYNFVGAPAGDYVVRFVYGDNKDNLDSTIGMTGNATAYNSDGSLYNNRKDASGKKAANTSNYDNEAIGKTATVYNGQDYKSTIYQAGFTSVDSEGFVNNEWHNLNNVDMNNKSISDARDSEARRLEVIANSQTITNANASVLETANDIKSSHTELYDNYYMFADTAKLNMSIENLAGSAAVIQTVDGCYQKQSAELEESKKSFEYQVPKIDFGLIERPKNNIILDKEISSIKLITNDGNVVFNARYDISYELVEDGLFTNNDRVLAEIWREGKKKLLIANVRLNKDNSVGTEVLQALDKKENKVNGLEINEGVQNFRFVNVDESILQGSTIEIDYKLTALNVSEKDYTSTKLADISGTTSEMKSSIINFANESKDNNSINGIDAKMGDYLGTYYYTGEYDLSDNNNNQKVVTTKVRQIVEYVDNDGVFTSEINNTENQSWKSTTANELAGNGYGENRMVDSDITIINEMYDKNGRLYINDSNHNIALSIDSEQDSAKANKDFEVQLTPAGEENKLDGHMSSMKMVITKTVSAQDDANNLTFDNIAEIVKFENTVGRRDITSVPGNSNPKGVSDEEIGKGEFASGLKERDSSATELVTFTPPTGIETQNVMTSQILAVIVAALGIVVLGIVVIKKKILTK